MTIVTILMYFLAVALAAPALTLGIECFLALPSPRKRNYESTPRPRIAVLVPAHNEEMGIAGTIFSIRRQLNEGDRLIVIADNCNDTTAVQAVSAGAIVWEREDQIHHGKGYALRYAFERLAADPPEAVICIDADCVLEEDCISRLSRATMALNCPVQAAYLMHAAETAGPLSAISSFAVLVKNFVRLRGLQRLGFPCLITGSGVAYPWHVLRTVPHPEGHIVEDMQFSTELALAGFAPQPCVEAVVHSELPTAVEAVASQRTRWEHGHLSVLVSELPRLLVGCVVKRSPELLALGLELAVPPLSLFIPLFSLGGLLILLAAAMTGDWRPVGIWSMSAVTAGFGLTLAWKCFGQKILSPRQLLSLPQYAASKLPIYRQLMRKKQRTWVRTERRHVKPSSDATIPHLHSDLKSVTDNGA